MKMKNENQLINIVNPALAHMAKTNKKKIYLKNIIRIYRYISFFVHFCQNKYLK